MTFYCKLGQNLQRISKSQSQAITTLEQEVINLSLLSFDTFKTPYIHSLCVAPLPATELELLLLN